MTHQRPVDLPPFLGRAATSLVAALLVGTLVGGPARAEGNGAPAVPPASAVTTAPASDVAKDAWCANPSDLALGLRAQDGLLKDGRRDEALAVFRKNKATRKDDPVAAYLLGRLEGGVAGLRAMWESMERNLGLPSQAEQAKAPLAEGWRGLALAEESAGRFDQAAAAALRRAETLATAESWALVGRLRERAGDRPNAEAAYRKAIEIDPNADTAVDALAILLARSGSFDEAKRLAAQGVERAPKVADAYVTLGLVRFLAGDKKGAAEAYRSALERAGDDPKVLQALAATYSAMEEYDLAKQALERARAAAPETGEQIVQSAALALQSGNVAEAQRLLAQAAKALPKNGKVAFLQGVCWQRNDRMEAAIASFRRAVDLEPRNASYALALAVALQESGQATAAVSVLEEAVARNPQHYGLQLRLGFAAMEKRRWTRAVEALEQATQIDAKSADPHFYIAVLYGDHLNRLDRARDHLRDYKRLGGTRTEALDWLRELEK